MSFARVRALVIVGMLAILALVFIVVALIRDTQAGEKLATGCQDGEVPVVADLPEQKNVKVNVFNGTKTPGLADIVGTEFANRQFQVVKKANDPQKKAVDGVAVLRYGPKAFGSAHLLRAYFLDEATLEFDPKRQDDLVDVVIGSRFQQLATTTEVHQAIAGLGAVELPAGTCLSKD
ncbi:LytR C-terminal domain-containing protein [Plantactinospora sp. GCM10030261]|uniref:LytR C-terminal domain-containing protein n=1 Tax=Plantactinospora sp. GCM10030261 TaxID=3273420 RepID=UPI003623AC60